MIDAVQAIDKVRQGPKGPQIGAFFDLDGTLVRGYTAAAFYSDRIRNRQVSSGEYLRILLSALDTGLGGDPTKFADAAFMGLRGRTEDMLTELGERLFVQKVSGTMRAEARDLVRAHRQMGHTLAIASSATKYQIEPVARDLGIEHILCTPVAVEGGILTGRLAGPMLWGEPKAAAVRKFARSNKIDCRSSYAYANGAEDVAFLASVGNPCALNPHPGLAAAARSQGWPVVALREPRKPGLRALLGTAAAMTAFNTGMGLGFAIGALRRDPELGMNAAIPLACVRRVVSPPPATPSPLLRARTGRTWRYGVLECPLAQLKSAGKAAGGSVNDAFVAALLGGLRIYHEHHGVELDCLPMAMPVSLRKADDPMGGNKWAGALFAAPIGIVDPEERIAAIRGTVLTLRTEPALDTFSLVAPLVNRLPSTVGAMFARLGAAADLSASNVPGLSYQTYLAGAKVERLYPFGPLPGVAVMAAMVSHAGTCCFGLNIDGAAVADVDALLECFAAGLQETLAVGRAGST